MFLDALRLADQKILVEQLRLIYSNMTFTILTTFPSIVLLVWTLMDQSNREQLTLWAAALSAANVYSIFNARRQLARGLVPGQARRLVYKLMASLVIGGSLWGVLAFDALGSTAAVGTVIVISVLAGVSAGAMGLLSPIFPAYLMFVIPLVGLPSAKLLQLDNPAYVAFGFLSVVYFGTVVAQCYIASLAVRGAIDLRFENTELLRKTELAQRQAEQANTAKSKFLAAASHDLRQPIHAQGLFLEVLSHTALTAYQSQVLASARLASQASGDMLNILLDFSRIEAGVIDPVVAPFKLQALFNKIENDLAPVANAKGLVYRSRETSTIIQADASLVEMVLRNLISNAIRYSDVGGVLVACRLHRSRAVVEVWDTGIGIAQENQAEIFREFYQLGNPERDRRKGLGLGLAIAEGLAKTMGVSITLKSTPGRGSVFKLTLPVSLNAAADVVVHLPLAPQANLLLGVRVLLIDDDDIVLLSMAQLLAHWGCEVATAASSQQALELARMQTPDVLVSDYRLDSHCTGAQAITAVRSLLGAKVPALLITGDTAPERLREALGSGIPLLHKPLAPSQLHKALVSLLGDRRKPF